MVQKVKFVLNLKKIFECLLGVSRVQFILDIMLIYHALEKFFLLYELAIKNKLISSGVNLTMIIRIYNYFVFFSIKIYNTMALYVHFRS